MEIEIGKLKTGNIFYLSSLAECQVKSTQLIVVPVEEHTPNGYVLAKDNVSGSGYYSFYKTDKIFIKN